jgi:hypothetical protein
VQLVSSHEDSWLGHDIMRQFKMSPPPPPPPKPLRQFISAHEMTLFAALIAFAQAPARQVCRHDRLKGIRQPIAQVTVPRQVSTLHGPQSAGQFEQVSSGSQTPLPQKEQTPQSAGQEAHVSPESQTPLPQLAQLPQSWGQVKQFSLGAVQVWSPQLGQGPQSGAHERQVSPSSHLPSGQCAQRPQSCGHEAQVSPLLHVPSPQLAQRPQSIGHV